MGATWSRPPKPRSARRCGGPKSPWPGWPRASRPRASAVSDARIAAVETATVTLAASAALAVRGARGGHLTSSFTLVRVSTDDGVSGHGEVSATPVWSGEDEVSAQHFVREVLAPALIGEPLRSVAALSARMDRVLAGNPFTKAGVNMALW